VFFYLTLAFAAYGLRHLMRGVRDISRELRIVRRGAVALASVQSGVVLVRGRVDRADGELRSAWTGVPCVAYEHQGRSGPATAVGSSFLLADGTASARVIPGHPVLVCPDEVNTGLGRERRIHVGDEIYVLALASWEVDPSGTGQGYRDPPKLLVLRDVPRYGVIMSGGDRPSLRRQAGLSMAKGTVALGLATVSAMKMVW
jgi:hypothetical protein